MKRVLCIVAILSTLVSAHADETPEAALKEINGLQRLLDLLVGNWDNSEGTTQKPDLRVLATGTQWAWSYRYETDNRAPFDLPELVVPVDRLIQLDVTSTDVIHQFFVPAFAIKLDGVPGRLAATWFKPMRVGTYYGQCSTDCGSNFADMAISIKVVSREDYAAWMDEKSR